MTFFQFASNNVRRNARAYSAYFLSSSFAIVMFFLYATLAGHPDLHKGYVTQSVITGMQVAEYIIFVFSFFSILYSMGSFLRGRNKEFGLLTILGISNQQLIWMVFLENMLLGIAALMVGVVVGLIGSKLFLLLGSSILDIPALPFYVPTQALLTTVVAFIVLFFLVSIVTTLFTRHNTVQTLLKGSQRPKHEPRISLLLAVLAAVLLIVAYVWALTYHQSLADSTPTIPLLILVMIAIGTYLLYTQLSVFLIGVLKKRRSYYWRGTHMLWLSELTYNMKDNARLFFVVAMILSVVFTATGTLAVLKAREHLSTNPFAFTLTFYQRNPTVEQPAEAVLQQTLDGNHLTYIRVQEPFITQVDDITQNTFVLMSVTRYNHLAALVHMHSLSVQPGEAVAFDNRLPSTIPAGQSKGHLRVVQSKLPMALNQNSIRDLVVVTDQDYQQQIAHIHGLYIGYMMLEWKATTNLSSDLLTRESEIISRTGSNQLDSFDFTSRALYYLTEYQLPNVTLFIGLFTALIFLIASCSFLYFRLYTTLNENREQYRAIAKIGLTETEMRASVTIQVAVLFFAPFLMAGLNTVCAMVVVQNNTHAGTQVLLPTVGTVGFFLSIQVMYFFIVRMQYLNQLKRALV